MPPRSVPPQGRLCLLAATKNKPMRSQPRAVTDKNAPAVDDAFEALSRRLLEVDRLDELPLLELLGGRLLTLSISIAARG